VEWTPSGGRRGTRRAQDIPLRYPSCVVFGRGRSRRCGGGFCVGGRGIRFCRFGSGRSCCRRGRRACPVQYLVSQLTLTQSIMSTAPPVYLSCSDCACRGCSPGKRSRRSYLSRVDLLTREGIFVGTHLECCVCFRR